MALVQGALFSSSASGKMSGLVAHRMRGGSRIRSWTNNVDPGSEFQGKSRSEIFSDAVSHWTYMVESIRDEWIGYAEAQDPLRCGGRLKKLTAREWFMRIWMRGEWCGLTSNLSPPAPGGCEYNPTMSLVWTAAGAQLTYSPAITLLEVIQTRQARNRSRGRIAPDIGPYANRVSVGLVSPVLVTGAIGAASGFKNQPPLLSNTSLHVWLFPQDGSGRRGVERFFRLEI